jgi:hypothetical protein
MDEPDTFLSAEAQQDLMKIFDEFAEPRTGAPPVQVVYVTHSPFLIDKNHAERIRVLQKGADTDGTRVIRNASQNHYEPLRSAFGAFVGETAFIGSCNLLVEGVSDQILLAGISRAVRRRGAATEADALDLNRLVIVPAGSASQVPYMLYLIRGRDAEKPPVIALLDSDESGDDAIKTMTKEAKLKRLIKRDYILQINDVKCADPQPKVLRDIEDLIPLSLAVAAANLCLKEIAHFRDELTPPLTVEELGTGEIGIFKTIESALKNKGIHLEKIAFARAVIYLFESGDFINNELDKDVYFYVDRMTRLFRLLNTAIRKAERANLKDKVEIAIQRQTQLFVRDHPVAATREQALVALEHIIDELDDSLEADSVKNSVTRIKRDHKLDEDAGQNLDDFGKFCQDLMGLKNALDLERLVAN